MIMDVHLALRCRKDSENLPEALTSARGSPKVLIVKEHNPVPRFFSDS